MFSWNHHVFLVNSQNHHVFLVSSQNHHVLGITMFSWSIPKSPCSWNHHVFLVNSQNHHVFLVNSKITMFLESPCFLGQLPKSPCFLGQFQNHHVCLVTSHKRTTSPDYGCHISRTPKLPSRQPGGWHHPRRSRNSYVLGTSWDILGHHPRKWDNFFGCSMTCIIWKWSTLGRHGTFFYVQWIQGFEVNECKSGWWYTYIPLLKNMKVKWDYCSQYMEKSCSKLPTSPR